MRICSNLLALAICLQFHVSRKSHFPCPISPCYHFRFIALLIKEAWNTGFNVNYWFHIPKIHSPHTLATEEEANIRRSQTIWNFIFIERHLLRLKAVRRMHIVRLFFFLLNGRRDIYAGCSKLVFDMASLPQSPWLGCQPDLFLPSEY